MSTSVLGVAPELINYNYYRFGRSRQRFRGPHPKLDKPYLAFIGGSETYGKFVEKPFPAQLGDQLGMTAANWGAPQAGPGFFLKDPVILEACSNAKICVVSVMGATNMSNRMYSVFHRRNARIRDVSKVLPLLFPDVELERFKFVHNLLFNLHRANPANFRAVELELREAWVARMKELLEAIETTRVLVWMSVRTPEEDFGPIERDDFLIPPAFVNRDMLEAVAPMADLVIEYVPDPELSNSDAKAGPKVSFSSEPAPEKWQTLYPGQAVHNQASELILDPLRDILSINSNF